MVAEPGPRPETGYRALAAALGLAGPGLSPERRTALGAEAQARAALGGWGG
jgi:hypothetical protein